MARKVEEAKIKSFLQRNIEARATQLAYNRSMSDLIEYGRPLLDFADYYRDALAHLKEKEHP